MSYSEARRSRRERSRPFSLSIEWREIAAWSPVVIFAYPLLVWPMFFSAFNAATGTSSELSNVDASQSSAINVLYFLGAGGMAVLAAAPRLDWGRRVPWSLPIFAVLAYLLLAALSVSWALAPSISLRRFIQQDLIVFGALFAGLAEPDPRRIVDRLVLVVIAAVGLNVLWLGVKPPSDLGVEGIYPQKNVLGAAMLAAVPILLFKIVDGPANRWSVVRLGALGALGAAFGLLVLSQSKTSLGLAFLVPLAVFGLYVAARLCRVAPAVLLAFGLTFLLAIWFVLTEVAGWSLDTISIALFNDTTFTGRTYIWEFIGKQIAQRPIFGYGFNSFWGIGYDSPSFREAPGFIVSLLQSHNGYMDVRLETGVLGFAILLVLIVVAIFQASRVMMRDPALGWMAMSLILVAVLHNLLESTFFRGFGLIWIAFLIGVNLTNPRLRYRPKET